MLSVMFWFSFIFYPIAIPLLIKRNRAKNALKYGISNKKDEKNIPHEKSNNKTYQDLLKSELSHEMEIKSLNGKNLSYIAFLNVEESDNQEKYYMNIVPQNCHKETLSQNIPVGKFYVGILDKKNNNLKIVEKYGKSIEINMDSIIEKEENKYNSLFYLLYDITISGLVYPDDDYDKKLFEINSLNYIMNKDIAIHGKSMEAYNDLNLS